MVHESSRRLFEERSDRVSRRTLHALAVSPWECSMQTYRRDQKSETRLSWLTPWSFPRAGMNFRASWLPFYLTIHAPRFVPHDSEVWVAIHTLDINGLRALFEARDASIYDVDEYNSTLLSVSPCFWYFTALHLIAKIVCLSGLDATQV